jgi:hypothetical protein
MKTIITLIIIAAALDAVGVVITLDVLFMMGCY